MRVLHVYAGNLYGGVEGVLVTLARHRALCPAMDPQFALCFEGRLSEELRACGVPVHVLGKARISRPWTVWRARRSLRQLLASGNYDTAVTQGAWVHCLFGPVIRSSGLPLAFWARDIHQRGEILNLWASWVRPHVLVCNSQVTERSLACTFNGITPVVIYNPVAAAGIDRAKARAEIRAELDAAENTVVMVLACRLERWKGHELLLDALVQLKDAPDWICCIAGGAQRPHEQAYLEELLHRSDRLGLARRVRWLGQRRDVPALLAAADIYCQPNTGPEPFGNAFVEALHAGLPVVATALGGPCEILTPDCGDLVPPGNPAQLAAVLRRLIMSKDLRRKAAEAGPRRAAELCDPARQLGRLFDELSTGVKARSSKVC